MFDPNSHEDTQPGAPLPREGPEVMQAFVARHRSFFLLLGVLLAQLLLLSFQITRNHQVRLIQVWAVDIFDPFGRSFDGLANATTHAWRTYRDLWQAQEQNQELNAQLATANSRIQQLSEQAAELDRLRSLLDFKNRFPYQTLAAEVTAASPGESSNSVFIDKGTDSGLTTDLAVITPAGVVGKTVAVFPHSAQVLLITDPSSGVGCMLDRTRTQGVLKGTGRNLGELHYVMNEEPVALGEPVVTSGLDQIYPKGLPVGTTVQSTEGNIYKQILVRPATALDRLESVLVVLKAGMVEQQALNVPSHP